MEGQIVFQMGPPLRFSMAELMVGTLSMGRTGPKASILIGLGVGPQWLAVESIRSHIKLVLGMQGCSTACITLLQTTNPNTLRPSKIVRSSAGCDSEE